MREMLFLDGQRTTSLRVEQGLSLRSVAKETGISAGHLSELERHHVYLSRRMAERIAPILGVSPDDLITPDTKTRRR